MRRSVSSRRVAFAAASLLAPAAAGATDVTVTSFDGTSIVAHWFPVAGASAASPRPTVMMGPGWGGAGDVDENGNGAPSVGVPGIRTLHDAGYNVLTWDPRGFGRSGGTVEVDSPDVEGRDTQRLIDWVAAQPEAALDKPGDPRLGMAGGSYGGGIQLVTAAIDHRVDAIAPVDRVELAAHEPLQGGDRQDGLVGAALRRRAGTRSTRTSARAYQQGLATGTLTAGDAAGSSPAAPGALVGRHHARRRCCSRARSTRCSRSTRRRRNYATLRGHHVPTRLLWFCGGHGACLTDPGDVDRPVVADARLVRPLPQGPGRAHRPALRRHRPERRRFTAPDYPLATGTPLRGERPRNADAEGHGRRGSGEDPGDRRRPGADRRLAHPRPGGATP